MKQDGEYTLYGEQDLELDFYLGEESEQTESNKTGEREAIAPKDISVWEAWGW